MGRSPTTPSQMCVQQNAAPETTTEVGRLVSLGSLAGGVAHEINNALTSMRLSLGRLISFEMSRRPMSSEGLHRIELLQDIREGVARVERIARELKAFSSVDDGPDRPIDVTAELDTALQLVAHELRHRARLTCRYAPLPAVRARPADLRQVFVNVLLNAIHAIPDGQAHLHEIRVTTKTDSRDRVVIEIADTGSGIPPSTARRVFDPFFTTTPGAGLGLGLTVSRDVVAALDGEIMIDSIAERGTTVRISLPATSDPIEDTGAATPAQGAPAPAQRRILIIDDDRPVAAAIALELGMHDVVVTESGREALALLRRDKDFDLILCDLMMPEVTGMDVYEALRIMDPALLERVVLMTGGAFTSQAQSFVAEVKARVLEKPFPTGQLQALVQATPLRRSPPADLD